ncbi:hypothetical protein HPB51_001488 [Rhipicephalus microplus]|uniref:PiggyBac transposable element-derived protein domain-containing protein n=1 Tax=Rhipicephalus microplus TaxID=6941 RepID=A0A9J6EVL6_RHIMP|nr:hypothetical protein HPB51_001488 [Rhipicephalus microplus]
MAATPHHPLRQPIAVASTSAASTDDFFDPSSADNSSDDFEVSESSSDDDTSDQTPQTSTSTTKVSTTYGKDVLPNPARRMKFSPVRQPGAHLAAALRSDVRRFSRALDFFLLFFTTEVLQALCDNTNKYAWMRILDRQTYARRDGSWEEVMPLEMLRFIGLIIYMGVVDVLRLHMYWRTTGIFSSLLPPNIMRRDGFFALLAFLSVGDPEDLAAAASDGKTWRVSWLLRHINLQSQNLFQPQCNLAVDERMVKSKARSGIRQYIRDKVMKFGYKLWVLADSNTGYTIYFFVYTGKCEVSGPHGLAFDVVTRLCTEYLHQGYKIFMDNLYTSAKLFEHLLEHKTLACGTTRKDRRGFPKELKDATWGRSLDSGRQHPFHGMEGSTFYVSDEHDAHSK